MHPPKKKHSHKLPNEIVNIILDFVAGGSRVGTPRLCYWDHVPEQRAYDKTLRILNSYALQSVPLGHAGFFNGIRRVDTRFNNIALKFLFTRQQVTMVAQAPTCNMDLIRLNNALQRITIEAARHLSLTTGRAGLVRDELEDGPQHELRYETRVALESYQERPAHEITPTVVPRIPCFKRAVDASDYYNRTGTPADSPQRTLMTTATNWHILPAGSRDGSNARVGMVASRPSI